MTTNGIGIENETDIETGTGTGTGTGTDTGTRDIERTGKEIHIVMNADGLGLVPVPANDVQQVLQDLRNPLQLQIRPHRLQMTRK